MEVYINESSVHEQFHDQASFETALQKFYKSLDVLNKQKLDYQAYQAEGWLRIYQAVKTKSFVASLNAVRRKDLRAAFFRILKDGLNAKEWRQERFHSADDWYTCDDELVTDTSMAEVAERSVQLPNRLYLLINFPESKYTGLSFIEIVKNKKDLSAIDCIDQHAELEKWLESNFHLSQRRYDFNSGICPTDKQTILVNKKRFVRTNYRYDGRIVYKEIATNYHWYVDNLHTNHAAHIEVFNELGIHLGEASIDGEIDLSKGDPGKRISF